jgi:signal transduction histidine kinase
VSEGPAWLDAIGRIFSVIPDLATPEQVQSSLREIREDSSLEVFWWSREDRCCTRLHPPLYYVRAEAVTNAVGHARASRAWLGVVHENGSLTVGVRDDGVGGSCVDCDSEASGSSGLPDRVEALDGTLRAESPRGSGTLLRASFPAAPEVRE